MISKLEQIRASLKNMYGEARYGRHRATFLCGDYVIKVPLGWEGINDNKREAKLYAELGPNSDKYFPLAKCWLVERNHIPLLYMEYVEHQSYKEDRPSWVGFVDCGQVGTTKDGRLVAYDYGE